MAESPAAMTVDTFEDARNENARPPILRDAVLEAQSEIIADSTPASNDVSMPETAALHDSQPILQKFAEAAEPLSSPANQPPQEFAKDLYLNLLHVTPDEASTTLRLNLTLLVM